MWSSCPSTSCTVRSLGSPRARDRRFLILRYNVQHMLTGQRRPFPDAIRQRLDPETIDLIELAPYFEYKNIVKQRENIA